MLTIACVKWGSRYSAEYVNILHDMVKRNLPEGFEGRFVCFTDDASGLADGIETRALPDGLDGWWNKIALFSPYAFPEGERVLYFDLDMVIVGALDDLVKFDGAFGILSDPYHPLHYNSSVMMWTAGTLCHIWDNWIAAGMPTRPLGDQQWIEESAPDATFLQRAFPNTFASYKAHCFPFPPEGTKVVFFHGEPKPHNCDAIWVQRAWKIGGENSLDMRVTCNVSDDVLLRNIGVNSRRDLPWLMKYGVHDHHAVIVGNGPSVVYDIDDIRQRKASGQAIFALNGAAKGLLAHGIVPDFHVILDARAENVTFLTDEPIPLLLASQVDPALFERAKDRAVTLWHPVIPDIEKHLPPFKSKFALVGGGTTVGLSAMCLVYTMGYRSLHLYGYDSSCDGADSHAFPQSMNAGDWRLNVTVANMTFTTTAAMAAQAQKFPQLANQLADLDCVITVHGRGLLPAIAHVMAHSERVTAAEMRAEEILSRLVDVENPVGAEIGCFVGTLSALLLSREDLTLYMVDSWTAAEPDSDYAKSGDFHGTFNQAQMDDAHRQTVANTEFAGERAHIVRNTSANAAARCPDASLDFVFIDADHSYAGCSADLVAWLPKVKPGGLICGHDYQNDEFPGFGVTRAVDEFARAYGGELEIGQNFTWFIRVHDAATRKQSLAA